MNYLRVITALGRNDGRMVGRDSFLTGLLLYIIAIAAVLRFGLPALQTMILEAGWGWSLADYYPALVAFMALFEGPMLAGTIIGFMLLDERDQHTLPALMVTPLPLRSYLIYRITIATLAAFVLILAIFWLLGVALIPAPQLLLVAAIGALSGPIMGLALAAFAENKVQGFAMLKIINVFGMALLAAWFVAAPLQYLFGIIPLYWVFKAYWLALAGNGRWIIWLIPGLLGSLALLAWLMQRFQRAVAAASR